MESRLKEIAQNIKKAATDKEAGKQTKTAIAKSYELSDQNDADIEGGYQTAFMDHPEPTTTAQQARPLW
jgi:hypothetical protein